jgi:hypothetical protein
VSRPGFEHAIFRIKIGSVTAESKSLDPSKKQILLSNNTGSRIRIPLQFSLICCDTRDIAVLSSPVLRSNSVVWELMSNIEVIYLVKKFSVCIKKKNLRFIIVFMKVHH